MHAAILDAGRIDALVVGDYVAEYGQGVALWRAAGFGKGPMRSAGPLAKRARNPALRLGR